MKKILAVFLLAIFIVSALPCVSAGFTVNSKTPASVVKAEQRAQRKPDLTLTSDDIVFSQASPTEGEKVTITATIHNLGNTWARSVEVGFYDGDTLIGIKSAGTIKAGGTGKASIEWTATPAGDHLIRVVADPKNKISESNEANNEAYRTITVSGVGVLIPDLTLTSADIAFTLGTPVEGQSVTIKATIHNVWNGSASNIKASFYDGAPATGTLIGNNTVASIAAGGTGTASVVWTAVVGTHDIYVVVDPDNIIAETNETNNEAFNTITVSKAPPYDYELFIEIDYIGRHEPTQSILGYIHSYYYERKINVTFYVENVTIAVINLGINYADGINDNEFWAIEKAVNDLGDDNYGAGDPVFGTAGVYSSKWKWVLFGTTVEGNPYVVGYTYVIIQRVSWFKYDLLAGNYIFIADETADSWSSSNSLDPSGAEAVVLMHEMGHSIGIGILDWRGNEVYCGDGLCVMATLNVNNAGNYQKWHYCDDHWATRNMDYYKVAA